MLVFHPQPRVQARGEQGHDAKAPCLASLRPVSNTCSSLRWVVGAALLLGLLEVSTGAARAVESRARGTTLATARVLSVPSASKIAAAEHEWMRLTPRFLPEGFEGELTRRALGTRDLDWLRAFVERCNHEQMTTGDHAHFELVTPPGVTAPILQLEWTAN